MTTQDQIVQRLRDAGVALHRAMAERDTLLKERHEPIAIVGMGCRFPGGAESPRAFWDLLDEGRDAIAPLDARWALVGDHPGDHAPRWAGMLAGAIDEFDAGFFGISAREARTLDPQHRLLLEVTWEAFEDAAIALRAHDGRRTGVFIGACTTDYRDAVVRQPEQDAYSTTGNLLSVAAGRVSYTFGFGGPCLTIDTACSSSLVAIHTACRSLRSKETDLAVAGGVNMLLSPAMMGGLARTQAMSPDGRCRTFDAAANGFVRGEGCGIVVLKRLSAAERDGDRIWAVIRGSAVNQDGRSTGLTAPNVLAQEALLRDALRDARVEAAAIGYVEAHGTGTSLGDPIEVEALRAVLGAPRANGSACVLGAAKTNIGHLEGAAGVVGVIKAALALAHERIPRNLNFRTLNPRIRLDGTALTLATEPVAWPRGAPPRFAGVSSFGMSGTNAHVIVEEAPVRSAGSRPAAAAGARVAAAPAEAAAATEQAERRAGPQLVVVSGKTAGAVRAQAERLAALAAGEAAPGAIGVGGSRGGTPVGSIGVGASRGGTPVGAIAYSLATTRSALDERVAVVAQTTDELCAALAAVASGERATTAVARSRGKLAFVFSGQGSQVAGTGRALYGAWPVFREALDRVLALFGARGLAELRDVMWPASAGDARLDQTGYTQPAVFALEYALAALWRSWGVEPELVAGHSIGEVVAACVAGVFTLEDAVALVSARARLMQALPAGGAMASIGAAEAAVAAELGGELAIAAVNGAAQVVIAGPDAAVRAASAAWAARGVRVKALAVSHAFHSELMEPMLAGFAAEAGKLTYRAPTLALISNLTGALAGPEIATAGYWVRHVREAVRFSDGARALRAAGAGTFVEIGARPTLLGLLGEVADDAALVASLRPGRDETASLFDGLGAHWARGGEVEWAGVFPGGSERIDLPTYAWQRERYWLEPSAAALHGEVTGHPLLGMRLAAAGHHGVYETALSVAQHAWLADHQAGGQRIAPAAAIAELVRAAAAHAAQAERSVRGLVLQAPLIVDGTLRVQVVLDGEDATVYSQPSTSRAGDAWQLHATAQVAPPIEPAGPVVDVAAVRARLGAAIEPTEIYARFARIGLIYGPSFRGLRALWCGPREALAELGATGATAGYGVAPTVLDAALQALIGVIDGEARVMPFEIGALTVHAAGGEVAWSHVQLVHAADAGADELAADVRLLDRGGACVATLRGVRLRRVGPIALAADGLYELAWQARPVAGAAGEQRWIVVARPSAWSDAVMAALPHSARLAVEALAAASLEGAAGVVYLAERDDGEAVAAAAQRIVGDALAVTQLLARAAAPVPVRFVTRGAVAVATDDLRNASGVAEAALWGFARTVMHELPELDTRLCDVECAEDVARGLAGGDDEDQVAWRGGARFVARLARAGEPPAVAPVLDGTVLVTGGLGALGLHVARWLAGNGVRQLVLTGRRGLASPGAAEAVTALEAMGARVTVVALDVAERDAVAALVAAIPDLRGVVHAAGVVDDGVIADQAPARLARVIDPKLAGAWHLHELTAERGLACFVMFSSAAGMLGAAGQSNYAAANAALDALAAHRRAHGLCAHSLAWGPWAEAGMAARMTSVLEARLARQGIVAWSADDGVARFAAAIVRPEPQLAVLRLDLAAVRRQLGAHVPPVWRTLIAAPAAASGGAASVAAVPDAVGGARSAEAVRLVVAAEVARVLASRGEVPPAQPLAELGLDSLMAVELRNALARRLELTLPATLAFDHPTVDALVRWLTSVLAPADGAPVATARAVPGDDHEAIAIVGFGCRYPGGIVDAASYWRVLSEGIDAVGDMPSRWDVDALYDPDPDALGKMTTRQGGFVADIERFDAGFFGISPREAVAMDPQQRLLLETAWEALEHGGIVPEQLAGSDTGVFVGLMYQEYATLAGGLRELDGYVVTGGAASVASGRLSYVLGLKGPSLTVDTACSSSLVTIHLACQALRRGECGVALAGGVALMLTPQVFVEFSRLRGLSPDGRCKSFAASADGVGWAEGCGMLVLKRRSDAERDGDRILGLIRGTAVNQDGRSNGLTAPNGPSQQAVIEQALRDAGVRPADVDYVECHGTGTRLGDPIEVQALGAALAPGRTEPVVIGSVKSNLGHTQVAAGAAAVMKVVLALAHDEIPRSLHAETPSPHIAWPELPVTLATAPVAWPRGTRPRIAGVSSFGISGTNAHVVIEEAPAPALISAGMYAYSTRTLARTGAATHAVGGAPPSASGTRMTAANGAAPAANGAAPAANGAAPAANATNDATDRAALYVVSGKSAAALRAQCARLATGLPNAGLDAIAYSLATTRGAMDHRLAITATTRDELVAALRAAANGDLPAGAARGERGARCRVAFVFSGQGSQAPGMGRGLYAAWPVFREALDRVLALFPEPALRDVMWAASDARLDLTGYTQPALFAIEYALAALWRSWGVEPAVVAGHSIGELVAACLAGVFTLEDAARLVTARAGLMQALPAGGAMASIAASEAAVAAELAPVLSIAAINGPAQVTIAGPAAAVAAACAAWSARGVRVRPLAVSHAFHSADMDGMLDAFARVAATISYRAPALPVVSNLSGAIAGPEIASAAYWVRHVREAVRFADGVRALGAAGVTAIVEVGPRPALVGAIADCLDGAAAQPVVVGSLRPGQDDTASMLAALGEHWASGGEVAWGGVFPDGGARVALPTYAWQRERYWHAVTSAAAAAPEDVAAVLRRLADDPTLSELARAALPEVLAALAAQTRRDNAAGDATAPLVYRIAWRDAGAPAAGAPGGRWIVVGAAPERAAFAAALDAAGASAVVAGDADELRAALGRDATVRGVVCAGCDERLALAVLAALAIQGAPRAWLVTRGAVSTGAGDPVSAPDQAILWGLGRAYALEQPQAWGGLIDLPGAGGERDAAAWLLAGGDEDQLALRGAGRAMVPRLVPEVLATGPRFTTSGTALVTGGLGGLGLHVARWLARNGVRDLLLVGRRGPATEGAVAAVAELTGLGATVRVAAADAADRAAMMAAVDGAPITAVFHVAGINDLTPIGELSPARLAEVLAAKRSGTELLAELTAGRRLDAFVCFSSIAGVWGAGRQAAYAASNAYLDAWADAARSRVVPALAVSWGLWDTDGGATDEVRSYLEARGLRAMAPRTALAALDRALGWARGGGAHLVIADVDWGPFRDSLEAWRPRPLLAELGRSEPRSTGAAHALVGMLGGLRPAARAAHMEDWLASECAAVLGHGDPAELSRHRGFFDLGMDSLMAVRLASRLRSGLGLRVSPAMIFEQPDIAALAQRLLDELQLGAAPVTEAASVADVFQGSDDDVLRLIADTYEKVT